jgi:hypothetical protein
LLFTVRFNSTTREIEDPGGDPAWANDHGCRFDKLKAGARGGGYDLI